MGSEVAEHDEAAAKVETSSPINRLDPSKSVWAVWIPVAVSVATLVGGGIGWGYSQLQTKYTTAEIQQKAERDENNRLLNYFLIPIQLKLEKTQSYSNQLKDNFSVKGFGILESYVLNAKKHGVASQSLAHGIITDLAQTDAEINTLLEGYDPFHLTSEFKSESDKFLKHSHTYVIRFKALPDLVNSNESFPSWMPFPEGFPSALEREIMARKRTTLRATESLPHPIKFRVTRSASYTTGTNKDLKCDSFLNDLKSEYNGAKITNVGANSFASARGLFGNVREYRYECVFEIEKR